MQRIHFSRWRKIMAINNLAVYNTLKTEGIRVVYVTYYGFIFSHWGIKSKNMLALVYSRP
jgi:hypothetical protein